MIDQQKITDILDRSKIIETIIERKKQEHQEFSNKLIELKTKKEQLLDQLKELGIKEEDLDTTINKVYQEVEDGFKQFDEVYNRTK